MEYYGESNCSASYKSGAKAGTSCRNKAYYSQDGSVFCGVHSKKDQRVELPKNPCAASIRAESLKEERRKIDLVGGENLRQGRKGHVIVTQMRMMKAPESFEGYLKIFPNFKHGNRKDGEGFPRLSPKSLGPVTHIMPNLPPAQNLENFHQFAKVFPFELDGQGQILPEVLEKRIEAYKSTTPYRHKYDPKILKQYGSVNAPLFSVFYDKEGKEHRFTYIQCRYFYCKKYEELVKKEPEFEELRRDIRLGTNLQIVGYDGYQVTKPLDEHYSDPSRPFGHELVLYTLLTVEDPSEYPWNKFYQQNSELYLGVGI